MPPPLLSTHPTPAVAVIYIALVTFTFLIYANPASTVGLGSIAKVYKNLERMAE